MRSLSDPEYNQFTQDNASIISNMWPGTSKIVAWGGMSVLLYMGPNYINDNGQEYPDIYLSDVSDAPQLQAMISPGYSAPPQTMLDTLPQAIQDTIVSEAATAGKLLNSAGQAATQLIVGIAGAAGAAAGAAVNPLLSGLSPILIVGIVVLGLMYLPKGGRS